MFDLRVDDAALATKTRDARQTRFHRLDVRVRRLPSPAEFRRSWARTKVCYLLSSGFGYHDESVLVLPLQYGTENKDEASVSAIMRKRRNLNTADHQLLW